MDGTWFGVVLGKGVWDWILVRRSIEIAIEAVDLKDHCTIVLVEDLRGLENLEMF